MSIVFFKMGYSWPLLNLFLVFSNINTILQKINVKKWSIQYPALGFNLATYRTWVSSYNHCQIVIYQQLVTINATFQKQFASFNSSVNMIENNTWRSSLFLRNSTVIWYYPSGTGIGIAAQWIHLRFPSCWPQVQVSSIPSMLL